MGVPPDRTWTRLTGARVRPYTFGQSRSTYRLKVKMPSLNLEELQLQPLEVAQLIVDLAADKLAEDILLLDLRGLASFADYFVIMSAESSRQIEALEEDLTQSLKDAGVSRHRREGAPGSGWVLLDFSDVIIHIFSPEEREFYDLERLWSRAPQVVRVL